MNTKKYADLLEIVETGLIQRELDKLLTDAFLRENPILAEFAILAGADVNINISICNQLESVLSWAIAYEYEKVVELCLEHGAKPSSADFGNACCLDNENIVKLLIDSGLVDINAIGGEKIILALKSHAVKVVEVLIKAGADLTFDDYTPLQVALEEKLYDVFTLMIEALKNCN